MPPSAETELVRRAARGNKTAFEQLVKENQKNVYNLALKLMKNQEDAADAAQEAFLKAYLKLSSFRGECKFSVWLYRIAYNCCMDMLRKANTGNIISLNADDENGEETAADIKDSGEGPEEAAMRKETREAVRREMSRLPKDQYNALVMREISGMSYKEISEALGVGEGTVKSRIFRARESLAERLKENGTFFEEMRHKKGKGVTDDV